MQDEPNRLIRDLLNPNRVPTQEEVKRILKHVAKAPFRSGKVRVDEDIHGAMFWGRKLGSREPSLTAHLAKRVLVEKQWVASTTPEQYVADLRAITEDSELREVVFESKDAQCVLVLFAPNHLPPERLGEGAESYLWVIYSADYGTIITGHQISGVDRITVPKGARWL